MEKIVSQYRSSLDPHEYLDSIFLKTALERGYRIKRYEGWPTSKSDFDGFYEPEMQAIWRKARSGIFFVDDLIASIALNWSNGGNCSIDVWGNDEEAIDAFFGECRDFFPNRESEDPNVIPVRFWHGTSRGPRSVDRDIVVPSWEEIGINYSSDTRNRSDTLHHKFNPEGAGQLLLWHGVPGTGKTYAIRSLMHAWQKWCSFEYIVDPDAFFGEAAYMMNVLLEDPRGSWIEGDDDDDDEVRQPSPKWRLLIAEDTGELLADDAKERTGQGLSRLLNVVDGLIGQGLRVLVLITTNERVTRMHKAVTRPGRAASIIEFTHLAPDEVAEWANFHGIEAPEGEQTIASLYAVLDHRNNGADSLAASAPIGFRPRPHRSAGPGLVHWEDIKRT